LGIVQKGRKVWESLYLVLVLLKAGSLDFTLKTQAVRAYI